MNKLQLIFRSLTFHARSHLGALLGAAIGTAVLVGALAVGDSVRGSLRQMALVRLGDTELALASNDRFFRDALANEIETALAADVRNRVGAREKADARLPVPVTVAPAMHLLGTAVTGDGAARASRVHVLGVDDRLWTLALAPPSFGAIPADGVVLNRTLAEHLRIGSGDALVLRVEKPSQLSRDAPLSPEEDSAVALRLTIHAIVTDEQFGRFSLQANQTPPFNAFVSLRELQSRVGQSGRANLLLVGRTNSAGSHSGEEAPDTRSDPRTIGGALTAANVSQLLQRTWQIADAELELRTLSDNRGHELRSRRVFLDLPVTQVASRASPKASEILTYLVNQLRIEDRKTPYSMVAAMGLPVAPAEMRDDEILINQWLADDLQAKPGDELELTYFVVRSMRKPEEQSARFKVRGILPMTGPSADRTLMPDFPGLTDAENCRDWDTGFALNMEHIRDKDEKYWDEYRGTPKAFVTLAAGRKMWSNRFGDLTAIRYDQAESPETMANQIRNGLDPASVGLLFQPVREQALAAGAQAQDFGQLFLGFSFFLIVAALLLMSMMFQFGIEQRAGEVGTLLAIGFTPRQVRRLFLLEGVGLALAGAAIGVFGGVGYARAMLWGLSTIWRDAVGTSGLRYYAETATLTGGAVAGVLAAAFSIWLALRKQARQPVYELLAEGAEEKVGSEAGGWKRSRGFAWGAGALVGAAVLVGTALSRPDANMAGLFFGAGSLVLVGGMGLVASGLGALAGRGVRAGGSSELASSMPSLQEMGVRNSARRRKRSLATVGLLACGSFLIASIGVFRLESQEGAAKRSSGTGGFAFIGETSLAVVHDLNSDSGRDFFGLDSKTMEGVQFVPFRVRDGEDASCLNLNRAQRPRLLGVRPESLQDRRAFTFAKVAEGFSADAGWELLKRRDRDDAVPAIGDHASIQWALGKKVGDMLDYVDERGRVFKLRLVAGVANSILQGSLIIDEVEFQNRFPTESGYRMFLIDAPSNRVQDVSLSLSRGLRDAGLELVRTTDRLAAFNAVQNTYLNTFQVLGGLGLLLGSAGLAVVVLRNVMERRGELALLLAVGFRSSALNRLVLAEHGALLLAGLALGIGAATVAVLPAVLAPGSEVPYLSLGFTLGAVLINGMLWTWVATRVALRGRLLDSLRNN